MNRFDNMSKDAMARVEEIMNSTKLNEFLHRKEEEEKKKTCILWILAIIGVVAAVAAIAYGVYVRKIKSFQTSAICCSMLGEKVKGKSAIGKVIDFLVIFGVLGALSSSLGLAVPPSTRIGG